MWKFRLAIIKCTDLTENIRCGIVPGGNKSNKIVHTSFIDERYVLGSVKFNVQPIFQSKNKCQKK